jgi:hypothetical protein
MVVGVVTRAAASSLLLVAAGCAGGSSPSDGFGLQRFASQPAVSFSGARRSGEKRGTTPYAYACDGVQTCYVYDNKGKATSTASGLSHPGATSTDPQGNWYITNPGTQSVLEYSPGGVTLEKTLADPNETPVDVAISTTTATVAVMNATNSISIYVSGATSPTRMLAASGAFPLAIAVDGKGNCYLAEDLNFTGFLERFDGCAGSPRMVGPKTGIHYVSLAFDGHDNLYFSETGEEPSMVDRCRGVVDCHPIWMPQTQKPGPMRFNARFGQLVVGDDLGPIYTLGATKPHRVEQFAAPNPSGQVMGVAYAVGPSY